MTKAGEATLKGALRLGAGERAELVCELLASLDRPADIDVEVAWVAENLEFEIEPWDIERRTEGEILP